MIWLIKVDDQWEFSNSCIKFALAGWFVSSHVLEVERRFLLRSASRGGPLGVAGATACYRVAAVLNFQFPVSRSSCMINAPSFWRWTYSTAIYIGLYQICLLHATIFFAPFGFLAFGSVEGSRGSSFRVVYSVTFEHMWTLNWNRSYQAHTLNLL